MSNEGGLAPGAPWAAPPDEVLRSLRSGQTGLSEAEATDRLIAYGPNLVREPARKPTWLRILGHLNDVLIYVLLVAAVLKAIVGDWVEFSIILVVAVVNAAIGFIQEGKAEKALSGISKMVVTEATVRRDGGWKVSPATQLTVGDVVRVVPGDRVPADLRILEANELHTQESALTGESLPSPKSVTPAEENAAIGDRASMLFSGTIVTSGQGAGVVTATGDDTEIGKVQTLLSRVDVLATPLTKQLARFGMAIAGVILAMSVVMVVIGRVVHGMSIPELVSAAIGVAVAAVPEGLPALVTITLALGVQQMARRHAITRKLPAVEALGSVTAICSDKTGTLTTNQMTVRTLATADREYQVSGVGYAPHGEIIAQRGLEDDGTDRAGERDATLLVLGLCNDAEIMNVEGSEEWTVAGDPTEGALRSLLGKSGLPIDGWARRSVLPFSSETKYMATLDMSSEGKLEIHVKGAPDRVLERCTDEVTLDGRVRPIDRGEWELRIEELSSQGLRVLAAARKPVAGVTDRITADDVSSGLELCGLVGIVDPPRPEVIDSISECLKAGIRVKMITGDHAQTATAIARELGILDQDASGHGLPQGTEALTGAEVEGLSPAALREVVRSVDVFARTSPEHKLKIVTALQELGEVVAMTGDGVNDAPALVRADVGVAMGDKGTEATKEAADIVLADDNFSTIVRAVEEGRRIYDNIRKSILFLLPTNGAQSLVVLVAVFLGLQLPMTPVQVLWINMVTGITLSFALAYEPAEPRNMLRPPRNNKQGILTPKFVVHLGVMSVVIGAVTFWAFFGLLRNSVAEDVAGTTAVTVLALGQLAYLFSCRRLTASSVNLSVFRGNYVIWISAASLLVLQLIYIYAPFMNVILGSAPIGPAEWGVVVLLALVVFAAAEMSKTAIRMWTRRAP